MKTSISDYWKQRSNKYNKLDWINNTELLDHLINIMDLHMTDSVLDMGCGTGKLIEAIKDEVATIAGVDISMDMLTQVCDNVDLYRGDIEKDLLLQTCRFNKIVFRMVLHHLHLPVTTLRNCKKYLMPHGKIYIAEGIPPSQKTEKWYTEMFKLKEKRWTLTQRDIVDLLTASGYDNINSHHINTEMNVWNWLANDDSINLERKIEIYNMHTEAPQYVKDDYKMKEDKNGVGVIITTKNVVIEGHCETNI